MRLIPRPSKEEMAASWVSPCQPEQTLDDPATIIRYVIPELRGKPRRVVEAHHPRRSENLESVWYELEENER